MTLLTRRRIVSNVFEGATTPGTFVGPTPGTDEMVSIRSAQLTIEPVRVDRPTLRQTLTKFPSIFPGQGRFTAVVTFELCGDPSNPGIDAAAFNAPPTLDKTMRAAGFQHWLNDAEAANPGPYVVRIAGNSPSGTFRHNETVQFNASGNPDGRIVGDTWEDDNFLYVADTDDAAGTLPFAAATTIAATSGGSGATVTMDTTEGTDAWDEEVVAYSLRSDTLNARTLSLSFYEDGKRYDGKGCAADVEYQFRHGDAVVVQATFIGVYEATSDDSLPSAPKDDHYVPPTFLGVELTYRESTNTTPLGIGFDNGTDLADSAAANSSSSLNEMTLRSGNEIILRENSLDPNGFTRAFIADRTPTGQFNPDEVLEEDLSFLTQLVEGRPTRLRCAVGAADNASNPLNGNTFEFRSTGTILTSLGDGDRDGGHVWDGQFDLTGGNYDYDPAASGPQQETPGSDNDWTIFYH